MNLSDAIERGISRTQGPLVGIFFWGRPGYRLYACALACAFLGAGICDGTEDDASLRDYRRLHIATHGQVSETVAHPVTARLQYVSDILTSLTDVHGWSREKIVAWLRGIGM